MTKPDGPAACMAVRRIALALTPVMLAACAVATPFDINSSGKGIAGPTSIALSDAGADGGDRARLEQALGQAFARHSVALSSDARYLADYSISIGDAEGGLTTSTQAAGQEAIDWEARPRKSRLFDGCDAKRLRATLVLLDRQTGSRVYRGEGEATACGFSDAELSAFADRLVSDALDRRPR
ncbi:hypothetical protein [Parerythrobacter aestuarii]|uniref:hypothetical protein n=1 Tax=Parerythrobacter aestuarii TaxID=3020909 RepID=UPI0024DECC11|nr:hypothetical protein [Parerythrobacter aestuarii]